ncbi:MAG: peptidase S9 family protein [Flavobacterium sp.]|nr:MAG: peptidase S9 family protein [Flavobacterium sp.]
MRISFQRLFFTFFILLFVASVSAQVKTPFSALDVFQLEYAGDPQISPDGNTIVYKRTGFDVMKDRSKGNLWVITSEGENHHKLTSSDANESQAKWSPSGDRIAFVSSSSNGSEIYVHWVASNVTAKLTQLENSPSSLTWSPDGNQLAFSMKVNAKAPVIAKMPAKPKGAKWAASPRVTDRLKHERDGVGYLKPGFNHLFVISSEGGAPRKLTKGNFNHRGSLSWSPNGEEIFFSGNLNEDWEYDFRNSEVYSVNLQTLQIKTYTTQNGPDYLPSVSPNGKYISYIGYQDKVQTYQVNQLTIMDRNGDNKRVISNELDRSIKNAVWSKDSKGHYILFEDKGKTKLAFMDLNGKVSEINDELGGTSLGRPYSSGSFSVSDNETIAFTYSIPSRPAELAITSLKSKNTSVLTQLNEDLLAYRSLGEVEEIWYKSSVDGRDIQGWIVYPSNFDKNKKYSIIVENHGGPILSYGPNFSTEIQLYTAAGYMIFYPNPRGSTSYGEEFGNLLYHNYPSDDYHDVMDGLDAVIKKGNVDEEKLFVTGGSAGGIMTAWIIGKTNRFKAAVVTKPVMNWISKTLTADNYYGYANSRYPGQPWENYEAYWKFSPISLVGNVETPTMVMVGMDDLRTPPSEAKQLYHALKLRKIETVLVEIPEASHGIAARPSNLIAKVAHTIAWFEKYK